jgi:hypothetical protein
VKDLKSITSEGCMVFMLKLRKQGLNVFGADFKK